MDEFKEVHKRTRLLEKENATEIINDIKEMAVERDIGMTFYKYLEFKYQSNCCLSRI